jgi:hypothetical protein
MGAMTSSPIATVLLNSDGRDDIIMPVTTMLLSSDGHDDVMMLVATVVHL